jgi:hypothetical protein
LNFWNLARLCDFVTDKPAWISYTIDILRTHTLKEILKMNPVINFLASTAGRLTRIVAGVALIAWGILGLGGTTGIVVAVVGAVPLLAGIFDFCIFAPLFGYPLSGPKIRAAK